MCVLKIKGGLETYFLGRECYFCSRAQKLPGSPQSKREIDVSWKFLKKKILQSLHNVIMTKRKPRVPERFAHSSFTLGGLPNLATHLQSEMAHGKHQYDLLFTDKDLPDVTQYESSYVMT